MESFMHGTHIDGISKELSGISKHSVLNYRGMAFHGIT